MQTVMTINRIDTGIYITFNQYELLKSKTGIEKLAVLDCVDYYNLGQMITRINVPAEWRGTGVGRSLLKRCCDVADQSKTNLYLEISAYTDGKMQYDELRAWYERCGFKGSIGGIMRRLPQ